MQDNLNSSSPPDFASGSDAHAAPMTLMTPSAESRAPQPAQPAADAPVQLRQAREMAGLHVAVLASMLKVPVKKLEALEAGRYDQLPDLTFARALAKSVCRQLKIDPVPILATLPQPEETWRDTTDRGLSAPFVPAREMGKPAASGESRHLSRPTVVAALLVVAAAVLWWSLPDQDSLGTAADTALTTPGAVTEPIMPPQANNADSSAPVSAQAPAEPAAPAVPDAAAQTALQPALESASEQPASPPAPEAPQATTAAVSVPAESGEILRLTAKETTWVEVLGTNGQVVMQRNLQGGESVGLSAAAPLTVVVGRADATEVQVRGQRFVLEPHTRNNVARFEVR